MSEKKPMKLKMLTVPEGMDLELIFDDEDIESIDDLEITVNHWASCLKLSIVQKDKSSKSE